MRLVHVLHSRLPGFVKPGDRAIDATAGNGHDTVRLAELVGPTGRVLALDIQETALTNTAAKLTARGIQHVTLMQQDHRELLSVLPADWPEQVAVITLNLGFLPSSDREIVTHPSSTIAVIHAAGKILRPGGLLSVLAYRGHAGGQQEAEAVAAELMALKEQGWGIESVDSKARFKPGPILWLAIKPKASETG